VDGINVRVFEQIIELRVAFFDFEGVADLIELGLCTLTDCVHVRIGMALVNGNEFSAEAQTDDGYIYFLIAHGPQLRIKNQELRSQKYSARTQAYRNVHHVETRLSDDGENPGRNEGSVQFNQRKFMPATMTEKATMKAVVIHAFGGPDKLSVEEVPIPKVGANDVLVRVRAAGVNPVDWKLREGLLPSAKLPMTMGIDFSGTVEAVGTAVKEFNIGEEIFGQVEADDVGSYAEFCTAPESACASKPDGLDHVHAAALPVAASTAWQGLFDIGQLQAGQKILIHAAAGGKFCSAVRKVEKGARDRDGIDTKHRGGARARG
jgi:hypothetical protein